MVENEFLEFYFNNKVSLNKEHRRHLQETSAVSDDVIKEAHLFSLDPEQAETALRKRASGLVFPYLNFEREIIGGRLRLDEPINRQKYHQPLGSQLQCYFLGYAIKSILSPTLPLTILEGEKKLLAYASLFSSEKSPAVAYPGCWSFCEKGSGSLGKIWTSIPLANRKVHLIPDNGYFTNYREKLGIDQLIRFLIERGAIVRLVDLRVNDVAGKIGVDDFLMKCGKRGLIERKKNPLWTFSFSTPNLEALEEKQYSVEQFLMPRIYCSDPVIGSLARALKKRVGVGVTEVRDCVKKLRSDWARNFELKEAPESEAEIIWDTSKEDISEVYKRLGGYLETYDDFYVDTSPNSNLLRVATESGSLVRIADGRALARELSDRIPLKKGAWVTRKHGDDEITEFKGTYQMISYDLGDGFLAKILNYANLRPLKFLSSSPIVVGSKLINKPGYHPDAKVFYTEEPVEGSPTHDTLKSLLDSFPFEDEASHQNALGLCIGMTLFPQEFAGCHPSGMVRGDHPNLGKSTLARCLSFIASGKLPSEVTFTTDDNELEKRICTYAMNSDCISIDNVRGSSISSSTLERSLTAPYLEYRILGGNRLFTRENNVQFFMTLNDGDFQNDLLTRSIPIILSKEALDRRPFQTRFDPMAFVTANREQIVSEIVGFYERWAEEGKPLVDVPFPKYPIYAATINGILQASGYNNFLENFRQKSVELDAVPQALLVLVGDLFALAAKNGPKVWGHTPGQWAEELKIKSKTPVFESAMTEKSRQTRTAHALDKLLEGGGVHEVESSTGDVFTVKVTREENPGKRGGNRIYAFTLVEGQNQKDPGAAPLGTSGESGAVGESLDIKGFKDLCGTSAPNSLSSNESKKNKDSKKIDFLIGSKDLMTLKKGVIGAEVPHKPSPPPPPSPILQENMKVIGLLESGVFRGEGTSFRLVSEGLKPEDADSIKVLWRWSKEIPQQGPLFDIGLADHLVRGSKESVSFSEIVRDYVNESEGEKVLRQEQNGFLPHTCYSKNLGSIYQGLAKRLDEEDLGTVAEIEFNCIRATQAQSLFSFVIDRDAMTSLTDSLYTRENQAKEAILKGLGLKGKDLDQSEAVKDVLKRELDLTVDNLRRETLVPLVTKYPILEELLSYHKVRSYMQHFIENPYYRQQTISFPYDQYGTDTGRYSSPFHSIPKDPAVRRILKAPESKVLVLGDYKHQESRILAKVSGDENMIQSFNEGGDFYVKMASIFGGVPETEVKPRDRALAKSLVFTIINGGTPKRLIQQAFDHGVEINLEEGKKYFKQFFERFPGVAEWREKILSMDPTAIRSILGRRFSWPEDVKKSQLLNWPIQGSGADMLKMALARLQFEIKRSGLDAQIAGSTHDSIIVCVSQNDSSKAANLLQIAMEEEATELLDDEIQGEVTITTSSTLFQG